jgi:hypothetical protein
MRWSPRRIVTGMDIIYDAIDRLGAITKKPRVFVSYASADKSFVERLASALESLAVRLWIDYREIRVGDSIVDEISKGLRETDALVVVLSESSVISRWVREEINAAFIAMVEGKGVRLCPALIQSCDVPVMLRVRKYADFTKGFSNGIRELIEGILPDQRTWEELEAIAREFKSTVDRLPQLSSQMQIYQSLCVLDTFLTAALSKRYQIEVRNEIEHSFDNPDFYSMFGYLEFRGLKLRSTVWAALRDFRGQFVHGHPSLGYHDGILLDNDPKIVEARIDAADRRAQEVQKGIKELIMLMDGLSTK